MSISDRPQTMLATNLLSFPSPAASPAPPASALNLQSMPHDIAVLRRPVALRPGESEREAGEGERLGKLAHDARNLVTSLTLMSGLLAEPGVLHEEHRQYAGDLQLVAASLAALVEKMAAVPGLGDEPVCVREPLRPRLRSGLQAGDPRTAEQKSTAEAGPMVKSCERLLAAVAGPGIALNISYERGLGVLSLSGDELSRVLLNLVKNASEAMPAGGRVTITVRRALGAKPAALITVEDTGAGIPAHAMGQIFQAGFTSKGAGRGWPSTRHHGLGLTIVRELVEEAGGSVRVTSTLKKGTTFELKLPCRKA